MLRGTITTEVPKGSLSQMIGTPTNVCKCVLTCRLIRKQTTRKKSKIRLERKIYICILSTTTPQHKWNLNLDPMSYKTSCQEIRKR